MLIIIGSILAYALISALVVAFVCMLSSQYSERAGSTEAWDYEHRQHENGQDSEPAEPDILTA